MTLLYPSFLWLFIPLIYLWFKGNKQIETRVHLLILMLIVIVLSRPVQEQALQQSQVEAKDIIIALDVSYSMQATDIKPSRYDFAKQTINTLLSLSSSDNIMLIAFTTNPLLLSPPTTDHSLISVALETLNPNYILTKGTSLEKLFQKIQILKGGHKTLILITDGGEERQTEKLVTLLQQADISLITLAMGTQQGTTIAKLNGTLLKDKEGNLVITRINPILKMLTEHVDGNYIESKSTAKEVAQQLYNTINQENVHQQYIKKIQRHYKEWYQLPLLLAILLFFILHTRMVKYLVISFALLGVQTHASFWDVYDVHQAYRHYHAGEYNTTIEILEHLDSSSLESTLAKANSYYKKGDYPHALSLYKSIRSTSPLTKQMLYYNMANAYALLHTYDKAKLYYTKVLQLGEDADARYNLAQVILRKENSSHKLGIAHPKSQGDASSKSASNTQEEQETKRQEQSSAGSGSGGEKQSKKEKDKKEGTTLIEDDTRPQKQPLSSKVYELINKGYIRETRPW